MFHSIYYASKIYIVLAVRITSDADLIYSLKGHHAPSLLLLIRREHEEDTIGDRLHAVIDTDEVTFADDSRIEIGVVVDQAVLTRCAAEYGAVLDIPAAVLENETSVQ